VHDIKEERQRIGYMRFETEPGYQSQELGAGAYVMKPYLLEKLGIAVRCELDKLKLSYKQTSAGTGAIFAFAGAPAILSFPSARPTRA
jgi:hypothetical protein